MQKKTAVIQKTFVETNESGLIEATTYNIAKMTVNFTRKHQQTVEFADSIWI